jgi:hypothetical protein
MGSYVLEDQVSRFELLCREVKRLVPGIHVDPRDCHASLSLYAAYLKWACVTRECGERDASLASSSRCARRLRSPTLALSSIQATLYVAMGALNCNPVHVYMCTQGQTRLKRRVVLGDVECVMQEEEGYVKVRRR